LRQREFGAQYRSTNIHEIEGKTFGTIVCTGAAPAQKWIANKDPAADKEKIEGDQGASRGSFPIFF
jgi:hypothetical protein